MGRPQLKSTWHRLKRAFLLPNRYGCSSAKYFDNLKNMTSFLKDYDVVGTFPITAKVLRQHPGIATILDGMEAAVHGLGHRDISLMERKRQESEMKEAVELFAACGMKPVGFRAPYLRWSESMLEAAAAAGFLYDSSMPVGWECGDMIDSMTGMKEALASYDIIGGGYHFPAKRGNLVEMPVALPDDEILIDRLRLTLADELSRVLVTMVNSAADSGGHLVLQLHPERFHIFREALREGLKQALRRNAWIVPLRDVAEWWLNNSGGEPRWPEGRSCALTVSGDIDAATLGDFFFRRLGK